MRNSAGAFAGDLGLCADDTRDLIDIGRVAASHDSEVLRRLRISLVRFAFFGPGRRAGSLDFTHEILAEYFAARYALRMVERAVGGEATESVELSTVRSAFAAAVGVADIAPGSLFHRYFARQLAATRRCARRSNRSSRAATRRSNRPRLPGATAPRRTRRPAGGAASAAAAAARGDGGLVGRRRQKALAGAGRTSQSSSTSRGPQR